MVVTKLTLASAGITQDVVKLELHHANSVKLLRVSGFIRSHETVETDHGESLMFVGMHHAINLLTGEEFDSVNIFLPKVAESILAELAAKMGVIPEEDATRMGKKGRTPTVRKHLEGDLAYAFDIVVNAAKNAIGYVYSVQPLIEPDATNPMKVLQDKINEKFPLPPIKKIAKLGKGE